MKNDHLMREMLWIVADESLAVVGAGFTPARPAKAGGSPVRIVLYPAAIAARDGLKPAPTSAELKDRVESRQTGHFAQGPRKVGGVHSTRVGLHF